MDLLLPIGLMLINGAFAMSEIALVTARRARLLKQAEAGDAKAALAAKLGEDPTQLLSTVQIGITLIGILNGMVGEALLAAPFATFLKDHGVMAETADWVATTIVVIGITFGSIIIGELVPKRLGQLNPEGIARLVARPMQLLALVTKPFVALLTLSTNGILRMTGVRSQQGPTVTEEEIHAMLDEGSEAGVIEAQEHAMVKNLFRLDDRQLGSLMIPRSDIVYLDTEEPDSIQMVTRSEHSRFPVCRGDLNNVLGVLNTKDLLNQVLAGDTPCLTHNLEPVVFVPETLTGMELLEHFRASNSQMVLVIDEYGEVQGIVTLQDVLEAVTGEFHPRKQEDALAIQRADGSWLFDGLLPIPELKDRLGIKELPEEDKGRYHTVSGLLMLLLGTLPQTTDVVTCGNWTLEIVDMDGRRPDKILASKLPAPVDSAPTA